MKLRYVTLLVFVISFGCKQAEEKNNDSAIKADPIFEKNVQKSSSFNAQITKKVRSYISANDFTPFNILQNQKLENIEENANVQLNKIVSSIMNGNQIYHHLKERTMLVGGSYLCNRCPDIHLNNASGFIVHEDGILVTNYHVIAVKDEVQISGIFASDSEGNVYPVEKILSASQSNDLAILKLDTKGKKLKYLSLANEELMGEDIYMMGHPFGNNFFMSKGITSRKYISERSDEPRISITAEFGQGASGGPVVNAYGEVIGVVSATSMHYANGSKQRGALQLIIKEAIPVSSLKTYFKK